MSKFIKLTGAVDNEEMYFNTDHIISFFRVENSTNIIIKLYIAKNVQHQLGYLVKESPETVKLMIEEY